MANPKGNEATLKKFESKWKSGSTQTIRVPIALADQVLAYARKVDHGENIEQPQLSSVDSQTLSQVIEILERVKETPRNNFSRDRKALVQQAINLLVSLSQVNERI